MLPQPGMAIRNRHMVTTHGRPSCHLPHDGTSRPLCFTKCTIHRFTSTSPHLAHVEAHQPCDHHGKIELPCDRLHDRQPAYHIVAWHDVAIAARPTRDEA